MEANSKIFGDYRDIILRRKWQVLIPAAIVALVSVVFAFTLPPVYRATATLLLEEQERAQDLDETAVATRAHERVKRVSQRILTWGNLQQIVDEFELYADERGRWNQDAILGELRNSIHLDTVRAEGRDPSSSDSSQSAIAFGVSFDGRDPEVAQRVVNRLASLYLNLNENFEPGLDQSAETSKALANEADLIEQETANFEQKLAEFEEKNANMLPEQMAQDAQALGRMDKELLGLDRKVSALNERKAALEAERVKAQSAASFSSAVTASSKSTAEKLRAATDPKVIALEGDVQQLEEAIATRERLTWKRESLSYAQPKYRPDHPYIRRLEGEIAALEKKLASFSADLGSLESTHVGQVEPAVLVTLEGELDSVNSALKAARGQKEALKAKQRDYEQRRAAASDVQRAHRGLKQDYENALARYRDIKTKQAKARAAQQLAADRTAERFTLLEPPPLPEQPIEPNRPMILMLGFFLAAGAGLGVAAFAEGRSRSSRGPRAADEIFAQPLSVNPFLEAKGQTSRDFAWPSAPPQAIVESTVLHQGAGLGTEVDVPDQSTEAVPEARVDVQEEASAADAATTIEDVAGISEGDYWQEDDPPELVLDDPLPICDEPAAVGDSRSTDSVVQLPRRLDQQPILELDEETGDDTAKEEPEMTFGQRQRGNRRGFYY